MTTRLSCDCPFCGNVPSLPDNPTDGALLRAAEHKLGWERVAVIRSKQSKTKARAVLLAELGLQEKKDESTQSVVR